MATPVSHDVALRCDGLVKRFGSVTAVDGMSFAVRRGECFGLLGPNGAGKTTTMEMLEGLCAPDAGVIEILGRSWNAADDSWLRQRLGVQLQHTDLADRLSVRETLQLFRSFYPRGPSVEALLAMVALQEKRDARVGVLSGGQKQRLSLACALAGDPEVVFLDEPTTGLDPQARLAVWSVVEDFVRAGGSVLLTTHHMEEAERLCSRIGIVDHGRIIATDTTAALIASICKQGQIIEIELSLGTLTRETLATLPGVTHAHGQGQAFRLTSTEIGATLPALLAVLDQYGDRVRALTTRASTLEDAFVAMTGRALRDG